MHYQNNKHIKIMAKKNKTQATQPILTKGQELIYSDGKTMMEKTRVSKATETGYDLENGMKIDFSFKRTDVYRKDSKESFVLATEENLTRYEAYFLQQKHLRDLAEITKTIQSLDKMNLTLEAAQGLIKASKYINKIKSSLQ